MKEIHCLIIEDNVDLLIIYSQVFKSHINLYYKDDFIPVLYTAKDIGEYYKIREKRKKFDIIISDWNLPERTTAEPIIRELLEEGNDKNMIYFITGYSHKPELIALMNEFSMTKILRKPVGSLKIIESVINDLLTCLEK